MSSTLLVRVFSGDPALDRKVANAHVRVAYGAQSSEQAYDDHITDAAGNVAFMFTPDGPKRVHVHAPGYGDAFVDIVMPRHQDLDISLRPLPLPRMRVDGMNFRLATSARWTMRGASMFLLYQRFLDGEAIQPLLAMLQDLRVNCVRVFGMCHFIPLNEFGRPAFKPQNYGDRFYTELRAFCALCAEYQLYVYFSVFPDNQFIMPALAEQLQHFNRVVGELQLEPNTLLELTNEPGAHDFNRVDAHRFSRPSGIAACAGSYGDIGGPMPGPTWDFGDYHPPRRYPTHIKDCCVVDHPNYVMGLPILLGEPDRYGSNGNPSADQARLSAGASRESALGFVFHSRQGVRTEHFDEVTRRCAEACLGALR